MSRQGENLRPLSGGKAENAGGADRRSLGDFRGADPALDECIGDLSPKDQSGGSFRDEGNAALIDHVFSMLFSNRNLELYP